MAVVVLMYHQTPGGPAQDHYDVPLATFRDQIERLLDAGVAFIRFQDAQRNDYLASGMHIALTFDDGHASNEKAFEFLAGKAIVPAAFIVRDWARSRPDFLSPDRIADLAPICDFGGHGATHIDLTSLPDAELREELSSSRKFLEDAIGRRVEIMALPGGRGDARVLRIARDCGYRLIGNSVPTINRRPGPSVNRICITRGDSRDHPLALASAGRLFWLARKGRMAAVDSARMLLGQHAYGTISQTIKRMLGTRT